MAGAQPASASTGIMSTTVYLKDMNFSYGGVVRAELHNVKAVFTKDTTDPSFHEVTISGQLKDASTDGYCAKTRFLGDNSWKVFEECNGSWKTVSYSLYQSAAGDRSEIIVYREPAGDFTYSGGPQVYQAVYPPAGY